MKDSKNGSIISQGEGLLVFTNIIKILADHTSGDSPYALFEENVPPLGGPPPHTHPDEEVFYILDGAFEFVLNDLENPFSVLPGSVIHVPSNAVHTFKNVGNSPGKMIVILSPGQLIHYFMEVGQKLSDLPVIPDLGKAPDMTKIDVEKAFKYAPKYQIEFIMPQVVK